MNYPFKTICCIISSPCHLCNLEYDKVELGRIQICQLSYLEKNMTHLIETMESDYSDDPEVIKAAEKLMADLT